MKEMEKEQKLTIFYGILIVLFLFLTGIIGCSSTIHIKQQAYYDGYKVGFDEGSKHILSCMDELKLKEYTRGLEEGYKRGLITHRVNNIPDIKEDEKERQK